MEKLSIIIPHYNTEQYIKLCLRSLRKYSKNQIQVIVVDNNSNDDSIEYLRSLSWIKLIVNHTQSLGSKAHAEALDLGVQEARGEWLCLFHSDTIVLQNGWDDYLILKIKNSQAVGLSTLARDINQFEPFSDKCKRTLHEFRKHMKHWFLPDKQNEKIMSFCFFIHRDIFSNSGYSFLRTSKDIVSDLYYQEIESRYPFLLLKRRELEPLLWHTSNVTSILAGRIQDSALMNKFYKKNASLMKREDILNILFDDSLDH
jgi:glycosyltransferase involved in cell wall biosynthesis